MGLVVEDKMRMRDDIVLLLCIAMALAAFFMEFVDHFFFPRFPAIIRASRRSSIVQFKYVMWGLVLGSLNG